MGRIDLNYVLLMHFDFDEGPFFFLTISCELYTYSKNQLFFK